MAVQTGYEQIPIADIRNKLRDEHGVDEEFLSNTKTVLVERLLSLENDDDVNELLSGVVEDTEDVALQPYTEEEAKDIEPGYGTELWHDFVMKQFRDDELLNDSPTADGCRRVIETVLGPISSTTITHSVAPSTLNNGTATVVVRIELFVTNTTHPLFNATIACEDIADVNKYNCDLPYRKHASATCATRAEGRVLRKLMRLRNVITAEEVSEVAESTEDDSEWQVDEPISDSQVKVIDMLCERLDLSVMDFINSGLRTYDKIMAVNKSTGQRMIRELNKIQRSVKPNPETVGPYVKGWESANED